VQEQLARSGLGSSSLSEKGQSQAQMGAEVQGGAGWVRVRHRHHAPRRSHPPANTSGAGDVSEPGPTGGAQAKRAAAVCLVAVVTTREQPSGPSVFWAGPS